MANTKMKTLHHFCCQMLCTKVCHDSCGRHLTRAWPLCAHTSFGSHHALFLDNLCPRNTFLLTPRRVSHHPWSHNNLCPHATLCPTPPLPYNTLCPTPPFVLTPPLASKHPVPCITICFNTTPCPTLSSSHTNLCPHTTLCPTPPFALHHPLSPHHLNPSPPLAPK